MKQILLSLLVGMSVLSTQAANITIKDADLGNASYTWTKNNTYFLDGFVYLETGGKLTIEAGTVIKGIASPTNGDNASALIITVGSQIFANGTAAEPIIFTSEVDDLNGSTGLTDRGLWGGLIILGNGVLGNSTPTANIEGIPTTETRAVYGGSNNADNSGTIRYISIRHGGAELTAGSEINGLTLGGVGSGTTIEFVEVFANSDDGIELFGGAVNLKYAVVGACGDDCFDFDLGWVGNGQFWFALQMADDADACGEFDGAIPDNNPIFSKPSLFNLTFIGAGAGATAASSYGLLIRDGAAGVFANSIFTEVKGAGIEVEDRAAATGVDSRSYLESGQLKLMNNIFFNIGQGTNISAGAGGIIKSTADAEDPTAAFLVAHLTANANVVVNPNIRNIARDANGGLDPRLAEGSIAYTNIANYPSSSFFTPVTYKGAFGDRNWAYGWTALTSQNVFRNTTAVETVSNASFEVFPNPANDVVYVKSTGATQVQLLNMNGQVLSEVSSEGLATVSLSGLASGMYFLQIENNTGVSVEKLIVR